MKKIYKTPYKRLIRYVGKGKDSWQFDTAEDFQAYLRKENTAPDYISIDGILYTMEEFDEAGQCLIYANRRNGLQVEVNTTARYTNGYEDAEVCINEAYSYRNGFVYAD